MTFHNTGAGCNTLTLSWVPFFHARSHVGTALSATDGGEVCTCDCSSRWSAARTRLARTAVQGGLQLMSRCLGGDATSVMWDAVQEGEPGHSGSGGGDPMQRRAAMEARECDLCTSSFVTPSHSAAYLCECAPEPSFLRRLPAVRVFSGKKENVQGSPAGARASSHVHMGSLMQHSQSVPLWHVLSVTGCLVSLVLFG